MTKLLYLDCSSGASGDMLLGALLDAGASLDDVTAAVKGLGLDGWDMKLQEVTKAGVRALRADVRVAERQEPRAYKQIEALLERAPLDRSIAERARSCFRLLAQAEARVHRVRLEDVHFHEVGSTDAIVDIVGCAAALEHLMPCEVVASTLATGSGTTDSAHGVLPVPAPAVLEIVKQRNAPITQAGEGELLTPTGAAIVCAISDRFGAMPAMTIEAIGYGAGERDRDVPNVVRALVGRHHNRSAEVSGDDRVLLIETNLDDISPELLAPVIDQLLDAGASDAWLTPIVMKKGRAAFTLSILTAPIYRYHLLEIVFRETTTLGVRLARVERETLERGSLEVEVEGERVRVKLGILHDDVVTVAPEYEDARRVASATGLPLKVVYTLALDAADKARRLP